MAESSRKRVFPYYLKPHDKNEEFLKWIGNWLRIKRANKAPSIVARAAKVPVQTIQVLEKGEFRLNLGQIREILKRGYGCGLEDVLAKCYENFGTELDPDGSRRFARDYHYSFCFGREDEGSERTPVLIGGEPKKFLWAVPFRRLKGQPLVTELLELAPARKRQSTGETIQNSHLGVEIVYVIHGSIRVNIRGGLEGAYNRELRHENCIHFNSSHVHQISNDGINTSALLLIARLPVV
jgi:hypothetical protein